MDRVVHDRHGTQHRLKLDPDDPGVTDLRGSEFGASLMLNCTRCDQVRIPVRLEDDPETVCRCATCGKRHSTNSMEVPV